MSGYVRLIVGGSLMLLALAAQADPFNLPIVTVEDGPDGGQSYTLSLRLLLLMTALTMLPAMLMMMTSFTRIIIVMSIMRQALGTNQTPSNQILLGLSLFLTFYIMSPVADKIYTAAAQPYMEEKIGGLDALNLAKQPLMDFMLTHTRENDLDLFIQLSDNTDIEDYADVPFTVLVPAFVTSELKTAFQIGFMIFIPFLIIDLVVAAVLMSMGMMMLSPVIISFPFKIMLFVVVDGWNLIIGTLAASFAV